MSKITSVSFKHHINAPKNLLSGAASIGKLQLTTSYVKKIVRNEGETFSIFISSEDVKTILNVSPNNILCWETEYTEPNIEKDVRENSIIDFISNPGDIPEYSDKIDPSILD